MEVFRERSFAKNAQDFGGRLGFAQGFGKAGRPLPLELVGFSSAVVW
jgi:hypothetical protein